MSLAVVMLSPLICSGLAYSGVIIRDSVQRRIDGNGEHRRIEELGDAEVEKLRRAVRPNEDVARLQIAMDHEILVREVHRLADLAKEVEPIGDRQLRAIAILVDRLPLDVFHDEVGQPVRRGSAVEQFRDVRGGRCWRGFWRSRRNRRDDSRRSRCRA